MPAKNYERMSFPDLMKLVDAKDPGAQNEAAYRCRFGLGVPQNDKLAVKLWRLSEKQKDATGRYNYGVALAYGRGIERNPVKAVKCFHESVMNGDSEVISDIFRICGEIVDPKVFADTGSPNNNEVRRIAKILGMWPAHKAMAPCL